MPSRSGSANNIQLAAVAVFGENNFDPSTILPRYKWDFRNDDTALIRQVITNLVGSNYAALQLPSGHSVETVMADVTFISAYHSIIRPQNIPIPMAAAKAYMFWRMLVLAVRTINTSLSAARLSGFERYIATTVAIGTNAIGFGWEAVKVKRAFDTIGSLNRDNLAIAGYTTPAGFVSGSIADQQCKRCYASMIAVGLNVRLASARLAARIEQYQMLRSDQNNLSRLGYGHIGNLFMSAMGYMPRLEDVSQDSAVEPLQIQTEDGEVHTIDSYLLPMSDEEIDIFTNSYNANRRNYPNITVPVLYSLASQSVRDHRSPPEPAPQITAAPSWVAFDEMGQVNGFDTSAWQPSVPPTPSFRDAVERVRRMAQTASVSAREPALRPLETPDEQPLMERDDRPMTIARLLDMRVRYQTLQTHPLVVGTGLCGIEIELENIRQSIPNLTYWDVKTDGSLRNSGREFVCNSPWGGLDLYQAVQEIDTVLHRINPDETWRCSTHVHVDVRNMTVPQLKRMILAYVVYEKMLFKLSGIHRYKNNFCFALGFAQNQLDILARYWPLDGRQFIDSVCGEWDKYTSLNFLPMLQYGSAEFRISEAKRRKGQLIRLVNRFLSLKEVAMSFEGDDESFINHLYTTDPRKIILKGLPKDFEILQEDLDFGVKLAGDVINLSALRNVSRIVLIPSAFASYTNDGGRRTNMPWVNSHSHRGGYRHTRDLINQHCPDYLMPQSAGNEFNFEWLFQVEYLVRYSGRISSSAWDIDWFFTDGQTDLRRMYMEYREERLSDMHGEETGDDGEAEWFEGDEDDDE